MASGPITSRQIDGEIVETVTGFIILGSKITADGDCSHEIKRCLLLGRKVMPNLDSILKSRDITLPAKVCLVKVMVFPVFMYGCEGWTIEKAERQRIDAFELWCWIRLGRTAAEAETPILWPPDTKNWHSKRPWCWERLKAGGEGDDRGCDGWMASPTQWTWVWVNCGSWWWTGRPGVLQSMGSQRVGHDWATELNWSDSRPDTLLQGGELLSATESWLLSNTWKWFVQRLIPVDKARNLGRGAQAESSRRREPRRTALPRGSVPGFRVRGLVLGLPLVSHSDSESFLVACASFSQDGFQQEGFWEVGRTYDLVFSLSFWPFSWWWLINSMFLTRTSCCKITQANSDCGTLVRVGGFGQWFPLTTLSQTLYKSSL